MWMIMFFILSLFVVFIIGIGWGLSWKKEESVKCGKILHKGRCYKVTLEKEEK